MVSRGGIDGLRYVQGYAKGLLANGWDRRALLEMDNALIRRNLSPGAAQIYCRWDGCWQNYPPPEQGEDNVLWAIGQPKRWHYDWVAGCFLRPMKSQRM